LSGIYVFTGIMFSTTLSYDDISSNGRLTTENLYAQTFRFRFPTVLGTTNTFFVCHDILFLILVINLKQRSIPLSSLKSNLQFPWLLPGPLTRQPCFCSNPQWLVLQLLPS